MAGNRVLWAPTFLAVGFICGCASLNPASREIFFFVEDADSISPSCRSVDYQEAAIACHRLARGREIVVGIRRYSDARIDREGFRKITFVIDKDVKDGEVIKIPSDRARAAFGSGLSFMPGKSGCYGEATSGTVSVSRTDMKSLRVNAAVNFHLKSPLDWAGECKSLEFRSSFTAEKLNLEDMGPWEGGRGMDDSLVSESVPSMP